MFPPFCGKALPSKRAMRRRREQTAHQMMHPRNAPHLSRGQRNIMQTSDFVPPTPLSATQTSRTNAISSILRHLRLCCHATKSRGDSKGAESSAAPLARPPGKSGNTPPWVMEVGVRDIEYYLGRCCICKLCFFTPPRR